MRWPDTAWPIVNALARALCGGWKLVTLRRVPREDFQPTAELFTALVVVDLLLLFLFAFAVVGVQGEINLYEVPRALMFVPLVLVLGMLARRFDRDGELLRLPVALAAVSIVFTLATSTLYLLAYAQWLPFLETYWLYFDYFWIAWAAIVVVLAAVTLISGALPERAFVGFSGVGLLVLPSLWVPVGLLWSPVNDPNAGQGRGSFHALAQEDAFYAQHQALNKELAGLEVERPGIADVYVLAAGLYAGEDVFMKEVRMITQLMRERFDARGRTVTLINNPRTLQEHPIASMTSIREALSHLGTVMNTDEDVLLLYVSSHGSEKHDLAVDFRPLHLVPVTPAGLRSALDSSGIRWKIVVISACYSGGFIESLKDERTMIITASSADRQSFGCGHQSDATYLAQALFGDALKKTHAFETAFEQARATIEQWERKKGDTPSQPQLYMGTQIRAKLAQLERRLARQ